MIEAGRAHTLVCTQEAAKPSWESGTKPTKSNHSDTPPSPSQTAANWRPTIQTSEFIGVILSQTTTPNVNISLQCEHAQMDVHNH